METSAADLRYNFKDVMRAVERNEPVTVLYHGKPKAEIKAIVRPSQKKVAAHPFFGMSDAETSVEEEMLKLRGLRY